MDTRCQRVKSSQKISKPGSTTVKAAAIIADSTEKEQHTIKNCKEKHKQ